MADAMNISPSPTPTTSGQPRRAATRIVRAVAVGDGEREVAVEAGVRRAHGLDQIAGVQSSTRCAITSESVSEWYSWPASESSRRSVA